MARGLSRILGIELMVNFNHPYFATNLASFWRKWHISLSTWLRDYLYIPLGGNRNGRLQTYRNLMVTMLLGGLWHGARWTFVIWGAIHGVALSVNRMWSQRSTIRRRSWLTVSAGWGLTMAVVVFAWVFFRSVSLESAADALVAMVTLSGSLDRDTIKLFALFVVLVLLMLAIDIPQARSGDDTVFLTWRAPVRGVVYAAMILTVLLVPADPNIPFIYFQF